MLFSSDIQVVPQGEEEIGYQDQGRAGGEVTKHKPRVFAAEKPGGWMDSTMASLVDEGDQCITVGQFCLPTAFTVNTIAEVTVLGTEVYNRIREKPLSVGR